MSSRELRRVEVLARVRSKELRLADAATLLRISYRQVRRVWKRYQEERAAGLRHRSAGRESNRSKPKKLRERVLRLVRKKYSGQPEERFGPTLPAEHLAEDDGLEVHPETLRRWMLEEGLWSRARKRRAHRKRRERKAHFGSWCKVQRHGRRYAPAKAKVTVCEWEDGRLEIRYRGERVNWEEIAAPPGRASPPTATQKPVWHRPPQPKPNHPWKQDYKKMRVRPAAASHGSASVLDASASASP